MTLTKLPLGKWWVETDENGEIIATYNNAAIGSASSTIFSVTGASSITLTKTIGTTSYTKVISKNAGGDVVSVSAWV